MHLWNRHINVRSICGRRQKACVCRRPVDLLRESRCLWESLFILSMAKRKTLYYAPPTPRSIVPSRRAATGWWWQHKNISSFAWRQAFSDSVFLIQQLDDGFYQPIEANRFTHIFIRARLQTTLPVAGHG